MNCRKLGVNQLEHGLLRCVTMLVSKRQKVVYSPVYKPLEVYGMITVNKQGRNMKTIICILGVLNVFGAVSSFAQSVPNSPIRTYEITGTADPFQNSDIVFNDRASQQIVNGIKIGKDYTNTTLTCDNSAADGSTVNLFAYCDKSAQTCAEYTLAFNSETTCRQVARCIMQMNKFQTITLSGNLESGMIKVSSLPKICSSL